jgi:hypothetical protein
MGRKNDKIGEIIIGSASVPITRIWRKNGHFEVKIT